MAHSRRPDYSGQQDNLVGDRAHEGEVLLALSGAYRRRSHPLTNTPRPSLTMAAAAFLTTEEVSERYRGEVSAGTLRNWRAKKIGPSFLKIGKAVLYPLAELEAWDRKNLVICRAIRIPSGTELETTG